MPSLHGAFPALMAFIAFYHYRWRSWPAFLYTALVFTAITYLGEHYLVDVLAGVVLAAICYGVAYHTDALERLPGLRRFQKPERAEDIPPGTHATLPAADQLDLGPAFLGTVILLLLAELFGLYTVAHRRPFTPSPRFIERELDGRSPMAGLYWGHLAFSRGDLATAKQKMDAALPELAGEGSRRLSNYFLGRSRFQPQTLDTARQRVRTLSPSAMGRWEGLLRALTELEDRFILSRLERLHRRMLCLFIMRRGMLPHRAVTAADMTAGSAYPQMDPLLSDSHALLAADCIRLWRWILGHVLAPFFVHSLTLLSTLHSMSRHFE